MAKARVKKLNPRRLGNRKGSRSYTTTSRLAYGSWSRHRVTNATESTTTTTTTTT